MFTDKELTELYFMDYDELFAGFNPLSKGVLCAFADKHEIPHKKYESHKKIVHHLSNFISGAGVYRRIAGVDKRP